MAAGKKRVDHVAWQIEVATNEEWEDLTKLQGIVDVYSEWCGPCMAMASHLKEIKLQLGDDLLHCALAKADGINQLSRFRGRSEPTWLFLAGGEPVAMIRGANAPLIRKTLLAELQTEKEVLEGIRQRASLSWDSFELPNKNEAEETNAEEAELTKAPDNWLELDALTLQGSYRLILDKLVQALAERPLEIVARSSVTLNGRDCLILWFPTSVEDESLAEWFESTISVFIAEVEPKTAVEEITEEQPVEKPVEVSEAVEKSDESPEEPAPVEEETVHEEPQYQPIEFHLVADPDEKEALVKKLEEEPEVAEEGKEEDEGEKEGGEGAEEGGEGEEGAEVTGEADGEPKEEAAGTPAAEEEEPRSDNVEQDEHHESQETKDADDEPNGEEGEGESGEHGKESEHLNGGEEHPEDEESAEHNNESADHAEEEASVDVTEDAPDSTE